MENFKLKAVEKLQKELKECKGDRYVEAVKKDTCNALLLFCEQDEEFAQAVVQSNKTLEQVCKAAVKDCGSSISDITVYRKAVEVYFPGATVEMKMTVDLCGSVREDKSSNVINLSLTDLFD